MKIKVDRNRCASSGRCVFYSGEVFDQDPDTGIVVLINPTPPPALQEGAREAARNCPAAAIEIEE